MGTGKVGRISRLCNFVSVVVPLPSPHVTHDGKKARRRRTLSRNIHRAKMRPTKQLCSDLNARNEKKHLYSLSTHAKKPRSIYNLSILPTVRQGEDLPPLPSLASLVYPKGRRRGGSVESGSHLFPLSSFLFLGRELFREREVSRPRPAAAEECLRHPGGRESIMHHITSLRSLSADSGGGGGGRGP